MFSKRDQRNIDRDSDSWMSKTQFNYQPNSNYNSPLIMNNIYNMNMNQSYNSSPVGGNYNNRDHRDGGNIGGNGRGIDRNSDRNMDRNNDRMG